ncbi:MAG: EAL domain-containing protein [Clostridium paraputrificum]
MNSVIRLDKYLVYQAKVDLNTSEIIGLEALVRFVEPSSLKLLNTETVINSISSIDEMIGLTNEVLNLVILDMKKLDSLGSKMNISINMSSKEICNINLYSWIKENFKEYKRYINRIEIEITEKYEIKDIEIMRLRISLLKQLGFTISIDDLGSGFNKIDIINDYNVDLVKVDKSMVRDFANKKKELEYIVDISKEKNIKLLVEGIESKEDLKRFLDLGFEFGQGYYFYKPMKLDEIIESL